MKKFALAAVAMTALLAASPAHATSTKDFVAKASQAGMFEIESSKLALTRATDPEVKTFAQKMIDEHTAASAALKAAMTADGVDMSLAPATLDEKHASKLKELQEADAEDFDEDYMDMQKSAHRKAVRLFKDYADDGENAALKTFAANTVATLEAHKEHAKKLEAKVD